MPSHARPPPQRRMDYWARVPSHSDAECRASADCLQSMVRRLQEEVEFVASPTALPVESAASGDDTELVNTLRSLIRDEHEGARHLRHLARQDPHLYNGLYPVLLETIARDSEKHATVLRYLLMRIEDPVS